MKDKKGTAINEIKDKLTENTYFMCRMCFLRGSVLTDNWTDNSDIDLLVVSDDFKSMTISKRNEILLKTINEIEYLIDAICLSEDEYNQIIKEERVGNERLVRIV